MIVSSDSRQIPSPLEEGRGRGPTRQRWEGEGHPCYLFLPVAYAMDLNIMAKGVRVPLTFPLLRNGPLPLPARAGRGANRCPQ